MFVWKRIRKEKGKGSKKRFFIYLYGIEFKISFSHFQQSGEPDFLFLIF